jgi:hypothetical protein
MRLPVYVPKLAALAMIQPGAGIVGGQRLGHPGKLLIDYEDNRAGAENIRSYADRLAQAADRHLTGYPTSSRLLADPDDLLHVGTFDTQTGMVEVSNGEALEAWLAEAHDGAIPDLDGETRTTTPPDFAS